MDANRRRKTTKNEAVTILFNEAERIDPGGLPAVAEWTTYVAVQQQFILDTTTTNHARILMDMHTRMRRSISSWYDHSDPLEIVKAIQGTASEALKLSRRVKIACCACSVTHFNLHVCSGCHLRTYCSEDCQRNDWTFHRHLCKEVSKGSAMDRARVADLLLGEGSMP